MAIAKVQQKSGSAVAGSAITLTFDNPTVTGNLIVVLVAFRQTSGGGVTVSITDSKSNTYATAIISATGSFGRTAAIYYAKNATGGASHSVTITPSASLSIGHDVCIVEVSGADTTAPLDKTKSVTAQFDSAPTTGASATLTQSNNLVLAGIHTSGTVTLGSGYTTLGGQQGSLFAEYKNVTATTAVTTTWGAAAGVSYDACLAVFKEATGGGATYTLTANRATKTPAPQAVALKYGRVVTAGRATKTPAVQSVSLKQGHVLSAARATKTPSVQAAILKRGYVAAPAPATKHPTVQAATLKWGHVLGAGYVAKTPQPQGVILGSGHVLHADGVSKNPSLQSLQLLRGRIVQGVVVLQRVAPQSLTLLWGRRLVAGAATLSPEGQQAELFVGALLTPPLKQATLAVKYTRAGTLVITQIQPRTLAVVHLRQATLEV